MSQGSRSCRKLCIFRAPSPLSLRVSFCRGSLGYAAACNSIRGALVSSRSNHQPEPQILCYPSDTLTIESVMPDAPHSRSHHGHDDGHDRKHQEEHDFAAANAKYFDENVHKFEQHPFAKELASRQITAYLGAYPFDEEKTVMMDFACGIGMVSRELAPYTKQIVGIDVSQGLVDEFNLRVNNQGLTPDEMKAVCVHLKGVEGELDNLKFDVIVCGMAYHHIQDIATTTQTLAFFLKPGGVLLVNDMLEVDNITENFKGMDKQVDFEHVVAHKHGFDEPTIRKVFEDAGLVKFELNIIAKAKYHKFPTKIFIAKGIKPEV